MNRRRLSFTASDCTSMPLERPIVAPLKLAARAGDVRSAFGRFA